MNKITDQNFHARIFLAFSRGIFGNIRSATDGPPRKRLSVYQKSPETASKIGPLTKG
jgi:hypothetical protein